jgi:phospholipase/carboxylesterase
MRQELLGELTVRITGGTDREGGGDGPLVVLLHGYGAPGDDLVPLWRVLPVRREVRFAFPEAPLELSELGGWGARAWWPIDVARLQAAVAQGRERDLSADEPAGLADAHEKLVATLDALEARLRVPAGQLFLGGFSQGAMLACDVALGGTRPLAGLALLSGTLLSATRWQAAMAARQGLRVFQSHGRQDPLLPFSAAERLRTLWSDAGAEVEFHAFNGGHEIPAGVLQGLARFIDGPS